jgi:tetratricopeptide (TPR) repeat protein
LLNIEFYNHCAFQTGQILFDDERFDAVRGHFQRYLEKNRPESNPALAIYWIGRSMWQMNEQSGTLRFYKDAVLKYGADRKAVGVDMILDEWVAATRKTSPAEAAAAWQDLTMTIRNASNNQDRATMLRFQRLLLFHPDIKTTERDRLIGSLLQPENIPQASPSVLETMLDAAIARAQTNLAATIAATIIDEFTETDYALDARMFLAQRSIAEARAIEGSAPAAAKPLYAEAIKHLGVIREVYASSEEAAKALLLLGELYRAQSRFEEADKCYQDVLGVRGWSNQWPEALIGRGLCAEEKRDFLRAAAHYERIYVMYKGYRAYCAKAYYRRAEALHRGYEDAKAIETLRTLLSQSDLAVFPEFEQAKRLLTRLGGQP